MIRKQTDTGPRSEQKAYIKHSYLSEISKLSAKNQRESSLVFDATRIIQHFREIREIQHQQLAGINIPAQLKVHLFGFSSNYYLIDKVSLADLVIEKHPLDGRIIMTKQKYKIYLEQKQQERQLKGAQKESLLSNQNNQEGFDMISVSSLSGNKQIEHSQDSNVLLRNRNQSN